MKILAIRGKNLASLGGDFAVELAQGALASAGIFAISGPTGSGKTTLLDAMCLALFDRTPRLNDRGGVKVGLPGEDEALWVASQDVRSLLRKGCSDGYAEVDFTGRDGRVYRARWSVRRARDRAEGQLQAQVMQLRVLETGEILGRTKSDVLGAIEDRLGLSFEQFRRSALLAQGDFAAFLRADERSRAELLEQMTGTGLYGQVSMLAFERGKQEQRALDELGARLGELRRLGEDERAELERALVESEQAAGEARRQLLAAEEARAWHRQRSALAAQLEEARGARQAAARAWEEASGEREAVGRAEAARPLRPGLERLTRAEAALGEARVEQGRRAQQASEAAAGEASAGERRARARAALEQARAQRAELGPALERATRLDAELAAARQREREREADVARQEAGRRQADEAREQLGRERAAAEQEHAQAVSALEPLAHVAPVAAVSEQVLLALRRYFKASRALEGIDRPALAARRSEAAAAVRAASERDAQAAARSERAAVLAADADERVAQEDGVALRRRREWLGEQQTRCASLARAAVEAREAAAQIAEEHERLEAAEARREHELRAAAREGAERERVEIALGEARRALARATAALDLTSHRHALVDGQACPLCGAEEHPWARQAPALDALVAAQQERVADLQSTLIGHNRTETSARGKAREMKERSDELRQRIEQLETGAGAAQIRWADLRTRARLESLPSQASDPGAQEAVVRAERLLEAQTLEVRAAEQRLDEAREVALRARGEVDAARREVDAARQALGAAREQSAAAEQALARADDAIAHHRSEQETIVEDLAGPFEAWAGWREALARDVEAFGKRCRAEVESYQRHEQARQRQAELVAQLAPREQAAAEVAAGRRADALAASEALAAQRAATAALGAERAGLLDGRPAAEVAEGARRAEQRAEEAEREAIARHEEAEQRAAAARGAVEATEQRVAERAAEADAARAALDERLAASGLGLDELRALAAIGDEALAARARALEALAARAERAALIVAERQARLEEHDGAAGPLAAEAAEAEADRASRALAEAEERLSTAKVRRADDDGLRERARQLDEAVAAQRQRVALWGSMSQLIGSADGKKFRVFAQSLTFDTLLAQANAHLDELARRYQLMRVPGTDLDVQVIDREMADEARATTSLSGGESFLISLALALALSSLGSRTTRVETLFIDEGFGTLDADSLELALSALDALQGTGRQVGLISHVPGLVERLGAHVRVQPCGAGRSAVRTEGDALAAVAALPPPAACR